MGSASLTSWGAAEATVTRIATGHGRDVFVDALDLATHFLTKTLPKVAAEMVLSVRRLTDTAEKNLPTYFAGLEYDGSRPI